MKFNKESGQALLVVVLVMVVALTVGLSLVSRSIVNIRTSTEEADAQEALAAAEAGIEQAIQTNTTIPLTTFIENNTTYNANVTEAKGADAFLANGGNLVIKDDGIDVWLVSHNPDGTPDYATSSWNGNLDIYWGDPSLSDCDNAAMEVAVVYDTDPSLAVAPALKRDAYDPCASRRGDNKFSPPTRPVNIIEGKTFPYKVTISVSSGLVVRVVPIYASTAVAVDGSIELPTQGFAIDSTGTSGAGDRQVLRSITYFKTYDQLATPYFMYGLFSP